ncbi:unnamed protein product [Amoebophrya sp. A25]|nr:unnamed protein product [Amoebophrya sp. A25]|eukprot:GSA25T00022115001.1
MAARAGRSHLPRLPRSLFAMGARACWASWLLGSDLPPWLRLWDRSGIAGGVVAFWLFGGGTAFGSRWGFWWLRRVCASVGLRLRVLGLSAGVVFRCVLLVSSLCLGVAVGCRSFPWLVSVSAAVFWASVALVSPLLHLRGLTCGGAWCFSCRQP